MMKIWRRHTLDLHITFLSSIVIIANLFSYVYSNKLVTTFILKSNRDGAFSFPPLPFWQSHKVLVNNYPIYFLLVYDGTFKFCSESYWIFHSSSVYLKHKASAEPLIIILQIFVVRTTYDRISRNWEWRLFTWKNIKEWRELRFKS